MWPEVEGRDANKFLFIWANEYIQRNCCNFKQKEKSLFFTKNCKSNILCQAKVKLFFFYHATEAFKSECTPCDCLNVKELLARKRHDM